MIRVDVLEELADDGAFVQRLVVILKCRDEAARVELEEAVWLVVRIYFDVLISISLMRLLVIVESFGT